MLQFPGFMKQYPWSTRTIPTSFLLPSQWPQPHSEELLLAMEEADFDEKTNVNMYIRAYGSRICTCRGNEWDFVQHSCISYAKRNWLIFGSVLVHRNPCSWNLMDRSWGRVLRAIEEFKSFDTSEFVQTALIRS